MSRIRFNIASLLQAVLFVAVGFAALREANETWESGLFTLTLTVLLVSILVAIHRAESRRAFWIGFALFGTTYLALSLVPSIETRLATTKVLAYLDSKVPGRTQSFFKIQVTGGYQVHAVAFSPQGNQLATSSLGTVKLWDATTGSVENPLRDSSASGLEERNRCAFQRMLMRWRPVNWGLSAEESVQSIPRQAGLLSARLRLCTQRTHSYIRETRRARASDP